jgi:hypothetical protein
VQQWVIPPQASSAFVAAMEDVLAVYKRPRDGDGPLVCLDGGVNFSGLWDKRPDDIFGLAASYSPVSPSVSGLDSDKVFFAKTPLPIRDNEMALELAYQAQILPGFRDDRSRTDKVLDGACWTKSGSISHVRCPMCSGH